MSNNGEHLHGHTTVTVDEKSTLPSVTTFLKQHSVLIGVIVVGVTCVFVNRAMLRKELRSINFSAQFWPDDFIDPEYSLSE